MHLDYIPYPATGYSSGDAAWQLTAATLVGLMSLPGLAVLYGGLVQKKWAVNTMLMAFSAFSLVLIVWALWAFNMGFGHPWIKTTVNGSPCLVQTWAHASERILWADPTNNGKLYYTTLPSGVSLLKKPNSDDLTA